jgi:hypothetical protein
MSLGAGLSQLAAKLFRIGHIGSFNDLMLAGTLSGVEMMGSRLSSVPHRPSGVLAAVEHLTAARTHRRQRRYPSKTQNTTLGSAYVQREPLGDLRDQNCEVK